MRKQGRACGLSQRLATAFHAHLISLMPVEAGFVVLIPPRPGSVCVGCGGDSFSLYCEVDPTESGTFLQKRGNWGELYHLAFPKAGV